MPTDAKYASAKLGTFAFGTAVVGVQYINISDSGSGLDAPSMEAQLSLSDSGLGSDVLQSIGIPISDSGAGTDLLSALQAQLWISETGISSDVLSALQAQISALETGTGTEVWIKSEISEFTGIIRSTLSMLERDMKIEQEEIGMELESLERKMKMELTE